MQLNINWNTEMFEMNKIIEMMIKKLITIRAIAWWRQWVPYFCARAPTAAFL
jgi:hypothetical protein